MNSKEINKRPAVSVIMPSLNVSSYIEQCVASVCNQTLQDIEILCIDAGSTDGTKNKLTEFARKDSRIRLIDSDRRSYGYQVNLGIEAANGEYIGIVETDDYIDANMYETLYAKAIELNAEVVKANYYCHTKNSDNIFEHLAGVPYDQIINPKDYPSLLFRPPAIWSGIYKKSFLQENEIGFLETPGASYQDTSFILKVWISACRVCLLKNAYLHYRMDNPNSSVNSKDKIFFVRDELLAVHGYLYSRPEKKQIYDKIIWDREADVYEWNYRRLSDELKYEFLCGVQQRFIEGLRDRRYCRRFLRWPVWRMVLEVAENPAVFMKLHDKIIVENDVRNASSSALMKKTKSWQLREKLLTVPEIIIDVVNHARLYGIRYCVDRVFHRSNDTV